jgi:hypothetical protein
MATKDYKPHLKKQDKQPKGPKHKPERNLQSPSGLCPKGFISVQFFDPGFGSRF